VPRDGQSSADHIVVAPIGTQVALKEAAAIHTIDQGIDDDGLDVLFNELDLLRQLQHPNIVRFYGVYEYQPPRNGGGPAEPPRLFLVTQYAANGSLSLHYRKSFDDVSFMQRKHFMLGVADALV